MMDAGSLPPSGFAAAVSAISSVFGDSTRREIYLYVRQREDGATAAEVAREFGLHQNVARHHLDKLAAAGHLEVATVKSSRAGRPSKRYRAVADGPNIELPIRYDDLLLDLLAKSLERLDPAEAQQLAEEVGFSYGRSLAKAMGWDEQRSRSPLAALRIVAEVLTARGFAAHAERSKQRLQIVSENCPFGDLVVSHPVICALDIGLVQGMLSVIHGDTHAAIAASRPMGDRHCVTAVEASTASR